MSWLLYTITDTISGGVYAGKTGQLIEKRWALHRWRLRRRYHHCIDLQRDWHTHGETAFTFAIVEAFDTKEDVDEAEQRLIAALRANGTAVYNQTDGGDGRRGTVHSRQSRQRLSAALKRFYQDPAQRQQAGARSRASWTKTRQSRIAKLRAYYATDEARRIKGESSRKRWAKPGERERQSERMRGKLTIDGADRIRTAAQQGWGDPEQRQQRVESLRAAQQRPEERQRKSEASARRYGYTYVLSGPNGEQVETNNLSAFARDHGFPVCSLRDALKRDGRKYRGWSGYIKPKE